LGIALGRIHLSYDDFCRCTLEEFEEICKAWQETRDADERSEWERMRLSATIAIQPHLKQKITAQKLLPLPWDSKSNIPEIKQMSYEQRRKRMLELAERLK